MGNLDRYSWWGRWKTKEGRGWLWWLAYERFLRTLPYPNWRSAFLKWGGARLGRRCFIHDVIFQNVYVSGFKNLELGDQTTLQTQCLIDLADRVICEDNVTISAGVSIFTHEDCGAKLGKPLAAYFPPKHAPVHICQGSWIGARATILAGVTIGACSVVGAGSLVTEDVPDWTVVAGVPAKPIRKIEGKIFHESKFES
jgi:maltose O-acetyltransferase